MATETTRAARPWARPVLVLLALLAVGAGTLAAAPSALAAESHLDVSCESGAVADETSSTGAVAYAGGTVAASADAAARTLRAKASVTAGRQDAPNRFCAVLTRFDNAVAVQPGSSGLAPGDPVSLAVTVRLQGGLGVGYVGPSEPADQRVYSAWSEVGAQVSVTDPERPVCERDGEVEVCRPAEVAAFTAGDRHQQDGSFGWSGDPDGAVTASRRWSWELRGNRGDRLGDADQSWSEICGAWPAQLPCSATLPGPPAEDYRGERTVVVDTVVGARLELAGLLSVLPQASTDSSSAADFAAPGGLRLDLAPAAGFEGLELVYDLAPAEVPAVSISDATVTEGDGGTTAATFTASLSVPSAEPVTVAYATVDGTAGAGDYEPASGTVTFAPGERERAIAVAVVGDGDAEPDETFAVELSDPVGATIGDGRGVGTILDDDMPPPALSVADASVVEGTGGRTTAVLEVTLSRPARGPVVFRWETADGSAQAPADYVAAAGTGLIPAGATRTTVGVTVEGDVEIEEAETVAVELSGISGAEAGRARALLTIEDDDACVLELVWEYVELEGCFVPEGGAFRAEGDVRLNGVELRRETSSVEIVADPIGRRILARGGKVQLRVGGLTLPSMDFDVTTPADNGEEAVFVTGVLVSPTDFVYLKGLAVAGPVRLRLTRARESRLELPVGIPLVPLAKLGDTWLKGEAVLVADNERGLRSDSVKVIAEKLPVGPVVVKRLAIGWDELRQRWEGDATVVVPTPEALELSAGFAFEGGRFAGASGGVDNLNVPIGGGVFLQAVSFAVEFDPLELEGGIGISAGPVVAGKTALRVDGTFGIRFDDPLAVRVRGLLSLVDVPLGAAWFDYYSSGTVEFGGRLELRLPDPKALLAPVYVEGVLRGWVDGTAGFAAYAGARVDVLGLTLAGAEVLVSNVGIAACGKLTWLEAGFGYRWETGELAVMGPWACSVGGYEPVLERPGAAAAGVAATPVALSLPASERGLVLKLHGDGGAPKVTLAGPGGRSVTTPAGDGEPLANDEFVVLQDEEAKTTIVAIRRPRGEWTLTELPGSPSVTKVEQAAVLPEPSVDASVRGPRDEPELAWRLEPRDGQVVTFVEEGAEVARVLGRTAEASGRMAFDPAEGPAGERRIVALVEQDGLLRERVVVATFTAQPEADLPGATPAERRLRELRRDVARARLPHEARTRVLDPLRAATKALARKPSDAAAACAALAGFRDAVEASPGIPAATAAAWLAEAGAIRGELGC